MPRVEGPTGAACGRIGSVARLRRSAFPCSRLQVRCLPSVASPFSGTIHALRSPCFAMAPAQAVPGLWAFGGVKVHRTFTLSPPHPLDHCLNPLHPSRAASGRLRLRTTLGLRKGAKKTKKT